MKELQKPSLAYWFTGTRLKKMQRVLAVSSSILLIFGIIVSGLTALSPASASPTAEPAPIDTRGRILLEYWDGVDGNNLSNLTQHANYPNRPTGRDFPAQLEGLPAWGDNYGTRMRGYVHPPTNGSYTFSISGSDAVELYLSTDADPTHKQMLVSASTPTGSDQWVTSNPVELNSANTYYLEVVHKAGAGDDYLAVGWQLPDGTVQRPLSAQYTSPYEPRADVPETTGILDTLTTGHPRLLVSSQSFVRLKQSIANNSEHQEIYKRLKQKADDLLTAPVSVYFKSDGVRLLPISRQVLQRVYTLSMAYWIENDTRYADRAWAELAAVSDPTKFPDWNPSNVFLDSSEMTHAVAIGYDWLYHYLTPEQRETVRTAMKNQGLNLALQAFNGTYPTPKHAEWVNDNYRYSNITVVNSGGFSVGALAIADDDATLSKDILSKAAITTKYGMKLFAPDGGWPEGPGYWDYATVYNATHLASLETAMGADWGLSRLPGVSDAGYFPLYALGPSGRTFNIADSGDGRIQVPQMFWYGRKFNKPVFGWYQQQANKPEARDVLWFDTRSSGPKANDLPLTKNFEGVQQFFMRNGWEERDATYMAMHAGSNTLGHHDLDLGTFVLDALGARWAVDLGQEDYNARGVSENEEGGRRWTFYRKKTEGQNTLVINPDKNQEQRLVNTANIVNTSTAPQQSFAVADLTDAYSQHASEVLRGIRSYDYGRQWLVQDEITANSPSDVWWFMHMDGVSVRERSADGTSVVLYRAGKRVSAKILAPSNGAEFIVMDAKPLWMTSSPPDGQNPNAGINKLAIHMKDVTNLTLSVVFTPLPDGETEPAAAPTVEPLNNWTAPSVQPATLNSITLDGQPLANFHPDQYTYYQTLPDGTTTAPTVAGTASDGSAVTVTRSGDVPGKVILTVGSGSAQLKYVLYFSVRNNVAGSLPVMNVTASAHDGNVPENTRDGNLASWWSADGDGAWIQYDLGSTKTIKNIGISWFKGDQRAATFDVLTSDDGTNWTTVLNRHVGSGRTQDFEYTSLGTVSARYVRLVGYGNTLNTRTSINELVLLEGDAPPTVFPPAEFTGVAVTAPKDSLQVNQSTQLTVAGSMSDGSAADLSQASITYQSDNPAVAIVSSTGLIETKSLGSTKVWAIVHMNGYLEYNSLVINVIDPNQLAPVADTFARDGSSTGTNFGTSTTTQVKKYTGTDYPGLNRQAFMKFDLSDIEGEISEAKLYLWASVTDSGGTEVDVKVHAIPDDWTEKGLNWNNKPTPGELLASMHVTNTYAWREVDLTAYIQQQYAGDKTASLALLEDMAGDGLFVSIHSKENSANKPYLKVTQAQADLAVQQTVNNTMTPVGQDATFTVTVTNNGPAEATGVQVTDQLPARLKFVSATPSSGTYAADTGVWQIGTIPVGGQATLQIVAKVKQAKEAMTVTATVTALTQPDPNAANNTASAVVSQTIQPLRPILECVIDRGNGAYTAFFNYKNENTFAVSLPVGPKNHFSPGPQDRGQPGTYAPGHNPTNAAFQVDFDGNNLVWQLNGRTSTASQTSTRCSS